MSGAPLFTLVIFDFHEGRQHNIVTGSAKRYTKAQAMIFLYKHCYSKTRYIFYSLKNFFRGLRYLQLFAYTHAKIEELNVLNWSSAQLKDGYLNLLLHSKNVVKRGWAG